MSQLPYIIGLGKTGLSCAHYLSRKNIKFAIADSRDNPPGLSDFQQAFPEMTVRLGSFVPELLTQASELIISPGVPLSEPAIAACIRNNIPVVSDIELFGREAQSPIIAITGTNAKGTVTTLVGNMIKNAGLKANVGGNIGKPALDLLLEPRPDFYVLEISSFQLETTHYLPAIAATMLNLTPDHLDRHGDMQTYQAMKQRIYQQATTAVFNRHDAYTYPKYKIKQLISFGLDVPAKDQFGIKNGYLAFGEQLLLSTQELRIQGKHNWANTNAALALGHAVGLPFSAMISTLKEFPGLEHRCEWVGKANTINWYNDSKGTNIGSTLAAIEGLGSTLAVQSKIILIAGGLGKGADFSLLQDAVEQYVRHLILIGKDAPIIANALKHKVDIQFADTLQEAIDSANAAAKPHDAVLLSPACASFDMFRDYEDRGTLFKSAVKELLIHEQNG